MVQKLQKVQLTKVFEFKSVLNIEEIAETYEKKAKELNLYVYALTVSKQGMDVKVEIKLEFEEDMKFIFKIEE